MLANTPSIAKDVGLSQSQVYRFGNREDIKARIEQEQMKLLQGMPDAVKNVQALVGGLENAKDKDERRLCYEASREVLKVAGILATPTQSTFVHQLYKQQNNPMLSPVIQALIETHNKNMMFDRQEPEGEKDKDGNGDG